jgi:hypothetical protein
VNTKVTLICECCSKPFEVPRHRRSVARCCSRKCWWRVLSVPLETRFLAKVDKDGPAPEHVPELGRCWVWTAATNWKGYGFLSRRTGEQRSTLAHRISWELAVGPIPEGLNVLHKCDRPSCCRPEHLFLGTLADNNRDMTAKGRHAKSGHPGFKRGDEHWARKTPDSVARGESSGGALITDETVRTIRNMAENGVQQKFIANKLGVSKYIVSRVVRRETWRHVA